MPNWKKHQAYNTVDVFFLCPRDQNWHGDVLYSPMQIIVVCPNQCSSQYCSFYSSLECQNCPLICLNVQTVFRRRICVKVFNRVFWGHEKLNKMLYSNLFGLFVGLYFRDLYLFIDIVIYFCITYAYASFTTDKYS